MARREDGNDENEEEYNEDNDDETEEDDNNNEEKTIPCPAPSLAYGGRNKNTLLIGAWAGRVSRWKPCTRCSVEHRRYAIRGKQEEKEKSCDIYRKTSSKYNCSTTQMVKWRCSSGTAAVSSTTCRYCVSSATYSSCAERGARSVEF